MQKFYRYFTLSVVALAFMSLFSWAIFNQTAQTVEAQTKTDESCRSQSLYILEDNATKTVHLVYDFSRGTVSIVQIQKGYNPPEVTIRTKSLVQ